MAKTLYDYWFVQFDFPIVTSSGVEKPYKSSGGKMVYNETLKREIPEGWEVKTVGELVNIFDSKRIPLSKSEREKKKGIFPYYGATEIMDYINDFIFDGEYILLAEDGSVMNSEGFPILQYIYGKTWVNNHAHVLQSKQIEYTEYLYKLLEMIPVILIKSGSIQMKINQDNLLNYKLLVAPETLILKYSKFAKSIRQKLIQNQKQNQELSALRDWLLPMLMNGQVKVG
jgi:type I restriction enzyme S subunit